MKKQHPDTGAKRHNVYSGYFPRKHNRLCSPDPLIYHSRSWRDLQSRSITEPPKQHSELLDAIGFVALLAFFLFAFLFLPELLGS